MTSEIQNININVIQIILDITCENLISRKTCECNQVVYNTSTIQCDNSTIQCDNCHLDVLVGCVSINDIELETCEMLDIPFICPKCERTEKG